MRLSASFKGTFLDIICLLVGTIMAYRGFEEFFRYDFDPIHMVLGLALGAGAYANWLMYRRLRIGYWIFIGGNVVVAVIFIFVLQDVWHHHVWPHIAYALVFVPFLDQLGARSERDVLRDPPLHKRVLGFIGAQALKLAEAFPALVRLVKRCDPLSRAINRLVINGISSAPPGRPLPLSLWTPYDSETHVESVASPRDPEKTTSTFASWPGLVDRRYTGRHLPPVDQAFVDALPDVPSVAELYKRTAVVESDTSALFCFFAQWFTDSFLRTHPRNKRMNTSNHEIDLCQIYGLGEETTWFLRQGAFLKSRQTPVGELPPLLAGPDLEVKSEFAGIHFMPMWATTFLGPDPEWGTAKKLRELLAGIGDWAVMPERWKCHYAAGLERANSTIIYSALNTIFLREHNRLAREISKRNPHFGPDRVFETARNINIVKLLKVIIEDYINHLANSPFKIFVEPGDADKRLWYRTNRIALEFDLLYRWHPMVPDQFLFHGRKLENEEFRFNNTIIEKHGVESVIDAAARQRARKLTLHNTPFFLQGAEERTLGFARRFRLAPFNAYRASWKLRPYDSFLELTGGDAGLAGELEALYPDWNGVRGIDRVDLPIGLLAEDQMRTRPLPPLLLAMVGSDAFSQALTNPLLARNVFGPGVFTDYGMAEIAATSTFQDIVDLNVAANAMKPKANFTIDKDTLLPWPD
jgi:prostaglandin-endoperoxide synthase 2